MTLGSILKSNLFDYFDVSYGIIYATDIAQVVPVVVACVVLDFLVIGSAVVVVRLDALALSVIATATWLGGLVAGWLAVTLRYCIKTAKPIGKLFRPSESPIILVF